MVLGGGDGTVIGPARKAGALGGQGPRRRIDRRKTLAQHVAMLGADLGRVGGQATRPHFQQRLGNLIPAQAGGVETGRERGVAGDPVACVEAAQLVVDPSRHEQAFEAQAHGDQAARGVAVARVDIGHRIVRALEGGQRPDHVGAAGGVIAQQGFDGPGRIHVIGAEHHDELAGGQGQPLVKGVVKPVVGGRNVIVEDLVEGTETVAGAVGRPAVEDNVFDIGMALPSHRPQGFDQAVGGVQTRRQHRHQGPVWVAPAKYAAPSPVALEAMRARQPWEFTDHPGQVPSR